MHAHMQVESVEVVRAYGKLLNMVLQRGQLLRRLQSALAQLQKAAQEHPQVPEALEKACFDAQDDAEMVQFQIKVRVWAGGRAWA
jgi:F0F1-type ATP synthase delta subunit